VVKSGLLLVDISKNKKLWAYFNRDSKKPYYIISEVELPKFIDLRKVKKIDKQYNFNKNWFEISASMRQSCENLSVVNAATHFKSSFSDMLASIGGEVKISLPPRVQNLQEEERLAGLTIQDSA